MTRGRHVVADDAATDPKWLAIGACTRQSPATVAWLWFAMLGHASAASPRGSVRNVDLEALAAWSGQDVAVLQQIAEQFTARGMVTADRMLRAFAKRQGIKADRTAAERQRRKRERDRAEPAPRHAVTPRDSAKRRHGVTGRDSTVTASHERDEWGGAIGGGSVGTASQDLYINTPNKRNDAHALGREEVIAQLDSQNAGGRWGWKLYASAHVDAIVRASATAEQLQAAIERARQKRREEGSTQPVNAGLVARFVLELRERAAAQQQAKPKPVAGASPEVRETPASRLRDAERTWREFAALGSCTQEKAEAEIAKARERYAAETAMEVPA